jgi:uncharacterized protein (DUF983 family)
MSIQFPDRSDSEARVVPEHPRSAYKAMLSGARCACPACGKGRLFRAFLKVSDTCPSCGEDLSHQRADDAPAYFTMFIVGHIIVAGILVVERSLAPPIWIQMVLWLSLAVVLSLALLQPVKGILVGLQWAFRMHGFGAHPDPAVDAESWRSSR